MPTTVPRWSSYRPSDAAEFLPAPQPVAVTCLPTPTASRCTSTPMVSVFGLIIYFLVQHG